jgi:hypothetical protein
MRRKVRPDSNPGRKARSYTSIFQERVKAANASSARSAKGWVTRRAKVAQAEIDARLAAEVACGLYPPVTHNNALAAEDVRTIEPATIADVGAAMGDTLEQRRDDLRARFAAARNAEIAAEEDAKADDSPEGERIRAEHHGNGAGLGGVWTVGKSPSDQKREEIAEGFRERREADNAAQAAAAQEMATALSREVVERALIKVFMDLCGRGVLPPGAILTPAVGISGDQAVAIARALAAAGY